MTETQQEIDRLIQASRRDREAESLWKASSLVMSIDPEAAADGAQKSALRRVKLDDVLKLLAAIDELFDPAFDPNDVPLLSVSPPVVGGAVLDTGIAPQHVKDPVIRKAYEEAIARNNEKARRYRLQMALRRLDEDLTNELGRMIAEPEPGRREIGEAVEKIIKNPERKARIQALLKTNRG